MFGLKAAVVMVGLSTSAWAEPNIIGASYAGEQVAILSLAADLNLWIDTYTDIPRSASPLAKIQFIEPQTEIHYEGQMTMIGATVRGVYDLEDLTITLVRPWVVANAEPISQYSQALNMVRQLPYSQALLRSELSLNRKIAAQFIGLRGIPTDEAKPFFAAAQSLSAELDDQEEAVNASWGLWSIQLMVAELAACLDTAETLRRGLNADASPEAQLIVEYMQGVTHAYRGTLQNAVEHLEAVGRLNKPAMKEELHIRFGMDIGLTADSFLA